MTTEFRLSAFVLLIADMKTSRSFYEKVLGQEVLMDHGLNVGYRSGLALLQRDYALAVIHGKKTRIKKGNDVEVYFECGKIDEAFSAVQASGAGIVHGLQEQPWGQRVFRFHDPDNFVIEIGEPMGALVRRLREGGMTPGEIAAKTTLPEPVVQELLA